VASVFSVAAIVSLACKGDSIFDMLYFTNRNIKYSSADVFTVSPFTGAEPAFEL
jgi:hypothetical protein